jgi:hypothetical protein
LLIWSLTHTTISLKKKAQVWGKKKTQLLQQLGFLGGSWRFLLCAISSRCALVLCGASITLVRVWQGEEINSCIRVSSLSIFLLWIEFVHGCIVLSERFSLRKVGWVFSSSLRFSQDKYLCLLVLVYLLLQPAYIFSIWLLNVNWISKYSSKSIATENLRKSNMVSEQVTFRTI